MIKYILDTTHKIIEGQLDYAIFSKQLTNLEYSDQQKKDIKLLVNALLNRYFRYFYSITLNEPSKLNKLEILALALYSYNEEKHVIKLSYEELLSSLPADSQVKLETEYQQSSFPLRIPAFLQQSNPLLSLAARFSVPYYVVEKLNTDIGKKNILRFLASRPQENSGIINQNVISPTDFYEKNKSFTPLSNQSHFSYKSDEFIKKSSAFEKNEIVLASKAILEIVDHIDVLKPKKVLFAQYDDTSLLLILALNCPQITIHYFVEDNKSKFILQHLIKKFNLKNVVYINSITQTYDLVLVTVSGSSINGKLRHRDFYYRLNENLDEYARIAQNQLVGLKDYVNDKGNLIFVTLTPLRSETHYQSLSFLKDHPEFSLKKEKQYFHFNESYETVYFGVFALGHYE